MYTPRPVAIVSMSLISPRISKAVIIHRRHGTRFGSGESPNTRAPLPLPSCPFSFDKIVTWRRSGAAHWLAGRDRLLALLHVGLENAVQLIHKRLDLFIEPHKLEALWKDQLKDL